MSHRTEVTRGAAVSDRSVRRKVNDRSPVGQLWSGIYNALWYPALPVALTIAGGDRQSCRERLGRAIPEPDRINGRKLRIWVHAASVGEIEGVRPVIVALAQRRRDLEFIITTMTRAGRDAARRRLDRPSQLAPFDHPLAVRAFLARIRPALLILAETELWPNYFFETAAAGIRIAVINGRVSHRSMRRYRIIRPIIARALKRADLVLAQSKEDADRFCRLGAVPELVVATGNAKYEISSDPAPLRPALVAFTKSRPILIAGSTGPGEERIVLTAFRELMQRFPSVALVLAPRHLQRISQVEETIAAAGFSFIRASACDALAQIRKRPPKPTPETLNNRRREDPILVGGSGHPVAPLPEACLDSIPPSDQAETSWELSAQSVNQGNRVGGGGTGDGHSRILLLDTMGELGALYQRATIAFVGGSLTPGRGGQSLAEPAKASVPVLFGPYYENHRQLGDSLIAAGAARIVHNAADLVDASAKWLADDAARLAAGQCARAVMEQLAGSTAATVRYLCALLAAS